MDCEGVQLPRLGLIQVRDVHRNIFLFRTGWNHRLLHEGGLKVNCLIYVCQIENSFDTHQASFLNRGSWRTRQS